MKKYDVDVTGGAWTTSEERLLCRGASVLLLSMVFTIAFMFVFLNIGRVNMYYVLAATKNGTYTNSAHVEENIFASIVTSARFPLHDGGSWSKKERRAELDHVRPFDELDKTPEKDDRQDGYVQLSEW
ncbi:hypothetical protein MTO96_049751 [Rhipicephalus appendiculatus]